MAAVALALLVAVVVTARRGNEKRAFVLAIAAALACSPILWLHYFALLLVPVAIVPRASRRSGSCPGHVGFGAGTGNGTTFEAFVVTCVVAATIALAVPSAAGRGSEPLRSRAYDVAGRSTTDDALVAVEARGSRLGEELVRVRAVETLVHDHDLVSVGEASSSRRPVGA